MKRASLKAWNTNKHLVNDTREMEDSCIIILYEILNEPLADYSTLSWFIESLFKTIPAKQKKALKSYKSLVNLIRWLGASEVQIS